MNKLLNKGRFEQVRQVFLLNHLMQMSDTGGQAALKCAPLSEASGITQTHLTGAQHHCFRSLNVISRAKHH